jgi:rod shape-determining protein MreC
MAVVDADGLVGRVTQVTAGYATVLLVTDPSSGVAATLAGGDAPGIVKGSGTPAPLLPAGPGRHPVRRGDPVLTQAYQGGVFPGGLPIGVVSQVDPAGAAPLVPRVAVRPYAALATLDVVAVVVDRPAPPKRET